MEYHKNLSLENLFYINENGLVCCEEFRDIPDYEGIYKSSNLGRVKSLKWGKERILKQSINNRYYLAVCLSKNGKGKQRDVHILVVITFLNHVPCGHELVVDHKGTTNPNNKLDNRLENLRIITNRENSNKKHLKSSSQYIGVHWDKNANKWLARIAINKKRKYLGMFLTEKEASEYYENALKAHLNGDEIILKKRVNTSNHKGVCWDKRNKKWTASIQINGKRKYLCLFLTEIEASNAYQNKLKQIEK